LDSKFGQKETFYGLGRIEFLAKGSIIVEVVNPPENKLIVYAIMIF
jgi:hypothetical protein